MWKRIYCCHVVSVSITPLAPQPDMCSSCAGSCTTCNPCSILTQNKCCVFCLVYSTTWELLGSQGHEYIAWCYSDLEEWVDVGKDDEEPGCLKQDAFYYLVSCWHDQLTLKTEGETTRFTSLEDLGCIQRSSVQYTLSTTAKYFMHLAKAMWK